MLFNLDQKKKKNNIFDHVVLGAAPQPSFDPLTYDGNTIALWDGDDLTPAGWPDQVSGQVLNLFNAPAINPIGLNGHGTITFNGVNQYAQCATPSALPFSLYLVFNPIAYSGNRYLLNDGVVSSTRMTYSGGSPNIAIANNAIGAGYVNALGLNSFRVVSIGFESGNNTCWWINNAGLKTAWGSGPRVALTGLTIGANQGGIVPGQSAWSYIVVRSGNDSQVTADLYINFLMTRFAL